MSTKTLLGDHVVSGSRNGYKGVGYRGVISFEHGAIDSTVGEVKPDCFTVWRDVDQYGAGNPDCPPGFDNFNDVQAAANAEYWWRDSPLRARWDAHPSKAKKIGNEVGANNRQVVSAWIAFEKRMIQLNEEAGRPYTFLIQSLANDTPEWGLGLWQELIAPFIVYAWERGHIYSRHAYCDNGPYGVNYMMINGRPSNAGTERPFQEFRWFIDNYGFCGPMVLGEVGFTSFPGTDRYVQEMTAYDQYALTYEYKGHKFRDAMGFMACFTDGEWVSANKQAANPKLNAYLEANPYAAWVPTAVTPPDPPDQPAGDCTPLTCNLYLDLGRFVHLLPQNTTDNEIAEIARRFNQAKNSFVYSVDDAELIVAHGRQANDEGKRVSEVKIWEPERFTEDAVKYFADRGYKYSVDYFSGTPPDPDFRFTHWPTPHRYVTQRFRANPADYAQYGLPGHEGTDIRAYHGDPVYAVADGVIADRHEPPTGHNYGTFIRIAHRDGYETTYAHCERLEALPVGTAVSGGQVIARADNTGNSRGTHLHLTLKKKPVNPPDKCGVTWPYNIIDSDAYLAHFTGVTWPDVVPCDEPKPPAKKIDLLPYLKGDGRLYEVRNANGGQERFQTQDKGNGIFWQTKNALAEMLYTDGDFIWRDWDTSPGNGRYYRQQAKQGTHGAKWLPRHMAVGGSFTISLYVQFYTWSCNLSAENSGQVTDTRKFVKHHASWISRAGITLQDVVQLEWTNGGETYFYAKGFGLVAWERTHQDANTPQWSAISEIHQPGQRPDNVADLPGCLHR